jgi:uncharacterized protein YjbI with pentapeptide repeats
LTHANLQHADLRGARLWGATLLGVNLRGAILRRANLQVTMLVNADLTHADLRGADLGGNSVWYPYEDLGDREVLGPTNLTGADMTGARYDARTRWPAGYHPRLHGAVLVR